MITDLPSIRILPLDALVLHERHDVQRTPPLMEHIGNSGILRNPPIVMPLKDGTQRHMVLDGANRVTALREMSLPHILVQVVDPEESYLELKNWNHVLWGFKPAKLLEKLSTVQNLELRKVEEKDYTETLGEMEVLSWLQTPDQSTYVIATAEKGLKSRVSGLNQIVNTYKDRGNLDRTRVQKIGALNDVYEELSALVIFPPFKINEVMEASAAGWLLPAGITRFTVSPRALRVNYPLEELGASRSLEEKNEKLKQWLQERMANRGVRFYAEPTVLFDE